MRSDPVPRALLALGLVAFGGFGLASSLFPTGMAALVDVTATSGARRADLSSTVREPSGA